MQTTAKRNGSAADRITEVLAFLKGVLAGGAVAVAQLEARARSAGLLGERQKITDAKTFKAAKKRLTIISRRNGFGRGGEWFWTLPAQPLAEVTETAADPAANAAAPALYDTKHSRLERPAPVDTRMQSRPTIMPVGTPPRRRMPRGWEMGVERLHQRRQHAGVPHHRWHLFRDDCAKFLDPRAGWAERAAELGWDAQALFGCDRDRPLDHPSAGLLWRLAGGTLLAIYRDWAVVQVNGTQQTIHRRPAPPGSTLPWSLRQ